LNAEVPKATPHWEIFCRVIDNFGDAGVCWRLARQLHSEHGIDVRFWIDDLSVLEVLVPEVQPGLPEQLVHGVVVLHWKSALPAAFVDVVIDAFGCGLDDNYQAALVRTSPNVLWVTLEYLSAESWVDRHHGLPSPHPTLTLRRYFFFPGFSDRTGGLIREKLLLENRDKFQKGNSYLHQMQLTGACDVEAPAVGTTVVSLFGYENPITPELLEAFSAGPELVRALVPPSPLRASIEAWMSQGCIMSGPLLRRGHLEVQLIPFVPQDRYDEVLWGCDWNFVRGEDSFVRAQWARRPLVWQIYPQEGAIHMQKLRAFLDIYLEGMPEPAAGAMRGLWYRWNGAGGGSLVESWRVLQTYRKIINDQLLVWEERLLSLGDLAENLVQFCRVKVQ
jgi:uncharacterized repeat protein (TIGR03837 family)